MLVGSENRFCAKSRNRVSAILDVTSHHKIFNTGKRKWISKLNSISPYSGQHDRFYTESTNMASTGLDATSHHRIWWNRILLTYL